MRAGSTDRPNRPLIIVIALVLTVGALTTFVPTLVTLAVALLAAVALGLALLRRMAPRPVAAPPAASPGADRYQLRPAGTPRLSRYSRWLFYGGTLSIALLTIRPAAGLNLSDLLYFAAIGLLGMGVVLHREVASPRLPVLLVVGILVFAVAGFASSLGAAQPVQSAAVVIRLLYLTLLWFWLGISVLQEEEHVTLAVLLWVGSAAITSAAAVIQFLFGDVIPGTSPHWGRMTGLTPHHNELGAITAVALVPAVALAVRLEGRSRAVALILLSCILAGELLSGSLSALAAAVIGLCFWLTASGLSLKRLLPLAGFGGAVIVALVAVTASSVQLPFERIGDIAGEREDATLRSRLETYDDALAVIDDSPLLGVGLDAQSQEAKTEFPVHNILLGPWFTTGILGMLGIAVILVAILYEGRAALRDSHAGDDYLETLALYAAFIVFVLYALTAPALYTRYGWVPVALLLAKRGISRQRRRAAGSANDQVYSIVNAPR